MPIPFTCPHCGNFTTVADQYAGRSGPCSSCGQTVTVPVSAGSFSAPPKSGTAGSSRGASSIAIVAAIVAVLLVMVVACGGVLALLMIPAGRSVTLANQRTSCQNNLRQIGLALHNYHDVYNAFPPAYMTDSDGNKTVSWRVLILPFLEQSALYAQIDTQKAWDAPENAALMTMSIPAYNCSNSPNPYGTETNYMLVTGAGTAFPDASSPRFADIRDGTSNTIAVVEVKGQGAHWAEPKDIDVQTLQMTLNRGGPGQIGSDHQGGAHVLLFDGSVRFIAETIDPNLLRALITSAGGEAIDTSGL